MATITAITSSGTPLNVLSPSTWVGGVVPGPADTAIFPTTNRVQYRSTANGYISQAPWIGEIPLVVSSTTGFPPTGSLYIHPKPFEDALLPVKIDYKGLNATTFFSCSVDYTFRDWLYVNQHETIEKFPGDNVAMGDLQYNSFIYAGYTGSIASNNPFNWQNQYEITGSGVWEVGRIQMYPGTDLTVRDSAELRLNSTTTTTNCSITWVTSPSHGGVRVLDSATLSLTGSYNHAGSTSVQCGISAGQTAYGYVIISGSSNYSSSILASDSAAGTSTINLQDATAFAVGDFITLQSTPTYKRSTYVVTGSNPQNPVGSLSKYGEPASDRSYASGSYYGEIAPGWALTDSAPYETDDIVQVESISGSIATVSQRYGKQGEIQQDLGLYTHRDFTETFNSSPEPYVNSMRAVLVDSNHKSYQAGETIIVSGSAYRVHHATTYLSQSKFIDFTNPATNWKDHIHLTEYAFSGSGYSMGVASYNPLYRKWTLLTTASRAGTSSLYINSASCTTPSNPSGNEACVRLLLKNTYFEDGEVTVSGSILRDFTTIDAASTALMLSVGHSPYSPYQYVSSNNNTLSTSTSTYDYPSGIYVLDTIVGTRPRNQTYGNTINWPQSGGLDPNQNLNDLPITPFTGSGQSLTLKIIREHGIQKYYLQDVLIDETLNSAMERGMISIGIQRFASIFSVNIKERYQLLLLDTQNAFSYRDFIKQGGLLDTQLAGKSCNFIANEIADPIGLRNLLWDYYDKKGNTSVLPYCHNYVQTTTGNIDTGILNTAYTSVTTLAYRGGGTSTMGMVTTQKTGLDSFVTYDLGTTLSFDTIGIGIGSDATNSEHLVNNQLLGVRIDVADDPNSWTTVWGKETDTRLATAGNAIRFYTFPSGSVSKRFVRFYSDGGSLAAGYNYKNFFGVYNFATGSNGVYVGNTTNQIKLRSAKNFEVGDHIMFWNKDTNGSRLDGGKWNNPAYVRAITYDSITNILTTATDNTVVGGLTTYYTITAKSGDVITLDRTPAYHHLFERTVVMKLNRGKINITGGRQSRFNIGFSQSHWSWHLQHFQHYNCGTVNTYGIQSTVGATFPAVRSVLEDAFLYTPNQLGRYTHSSVSKQRERNVIGRVFSIGPGQSNSFYTSYTSVAFNIFNYLSPNPPFFWPLDGSDKFVANHIVLTHATNTNYPAVTSIQGSWDRGCKIFYKNNYLDLLNNTDPRAFNYSYFAPYYIDQLIKSTIWENNYHTGTIGSTYGSATTGGDLTAVSKWKVTDYKNMNSMAPPETRLGSIYSTINNIPYLNSAAGSYLDDRGHLEYTQLRRDKEQCIRLYSRINSSIFIFNESTYYSVWTLLTANTAYERGLFLNCSFYVNQLAQVKIQLDIIARVMNGKKHMLYSYPTNTSLNQQGYMYPNQVIPKIIIVDKQNRVVLSRSLVDDINWKSINIDETLTLTPGEYSIRFELGTIIIPGNFTSLGQHVLDYMRPTLNILTENPEDVTVYYNNWDVHKLYDSVEANVPLDPLVTKNRGADTVARVTNDLNTTVKFNKVKL